MIKRQSEILEELSKKDRLEIKKLADILNVSTVTIRKDVDFLEGKGFLKRNHGYVSINMEDDISQRLSYKYNTKYAIAKKAIELISSGESLMIESGSTCALFAKLLTEEKHGTTIITNSIFIPTYLKENSNTHIEVLGGSLQHSSLVNVGPITKLSAERYFVDKIFIGVDGYTEQNVFTCINQLRAETTIAMSEQAKKIIILTESGKFFQTGVAPLFSANNIDTVITDNGIESDIKNKLEDFGIEVITADNI